MLVDIFSSFDPATHQMFNISPSLFWGLIPISLALLLSSAWAAKSSFLSYQTPLISFMYTQIVQSKSSTLKGLTSLIAPLFITIILLNFLGLSPYIFSPSSHLLLTMSFGIPLWFALIMSSFINSPKEFTASFLPSGAPSWLAPALVIIESVSILVRPITLSFRLAANMSAGHIVLGLINMYTASALVAFTPPAPTLLLISVGYTAFEVGICLVQAYIFSLLISLYANDHST